MSETDEVIWVPFEDTIREALDLLEDSPSIAHTALDSLLARLRTVEAEQRKTSIELANEKAIHEETRRRYQIRRDLQEAAEARVEALSQALRFYADPSTYEESAQPHPTKLYSGVIPIEADSGSAARAALAVSGNQPQ